jgi:hypothetical protein
VALNIFILLGFIPKLRRVMFAAPSLKSTLHRGDLPTQGSFLQCEADRYASVIRKKVHQNKGFDVYGRKDRRCTDYWMPADSGV